MGISQSGYLLFLGVVKDAIRVRAVRGQNVQAYGLDLNFLKAMALQALMIVGKIPSSRRASGAFGIRNLVIL